MSLENPYAASPAVSRGGADDPSLFVACACGRRIVVNEGQAGSTIPCPCGKSVAVPRLGELRVQAGLSAYKENSAERIVRLVRAGALPEERECVDCGQPTDSIALGSAHCEQSWRKHDVARADGLKIFLQVVLLFLRTIYWSLAQFRTRSAELGRDTTAPVRLRMCAACQRARNERFWRRLPHWPTLGAAAAGLIVVWESWPAALGIWILTLAYDRVRVWGKRVHQRRWQTIARVVPVYADLLDEFPETEIQMVGIL